MRIALTVSYIHSATTVAPESIPPGVEPRKGRGLQDASIFSVHSAHAAMPCPYYGRFLVFRDVGDQNLGGQH